MSNKPRPKRDLSMPPPPTLPKQYMSEKTWWRVSAQMKAIVGEKLTEDERRWVYPSVAV